MNKIKFTTILVVLIFQIKGLIAIEPLPYRMPVYNYKWKSAKIVRHRSHNVCNVICPGIAAHTYNGNSDSESKIFIRQPRSEKPPFQDGFCYASQKEPIQCEHYINGFNVHIECAIVISDKDDDGAAKRLAEYYRENQRFIQLLISYTLYGKFLTYMIVHNIPNKQKPQLVLSKELKTPIGAELTFASYLNHHIKSLIKKHMNSLPHTPYIKVGSKKVKNFYIKSPAIPLLVKKRESYLPKYDSSYSFRKTNEKLDWLHEQFKIANDAYKKTELPEFSVLITWAYIMDCPDTTATWERTFFMDKCKLHQNNIHGHLTLF